VAKIATKPGVKFEDCHRIFGFLHRFLLKIIRAKKLHEYFGIYI
jgi:hypothetical protein